ncbi:membrane protein [Streptomyces purpurascens]
MTVLCTKPVQRMFRFAMEPKHGRAFKRDAASLACERQSAERREREKVSA